MAMDSDVVRVIKPGVAGLWRVDAGHFPAKEDVQGVCHHGACGGEGGAGKEHPHPIQDQLRRLGNGDSFHGAGTLTVGCCQH
jgi:hypothetical protein